MSITPARRLHLHVTPYHVHQFGAPLKGKNISAVGGYYRTPLYGTLNESPIVNGKTLSGYNLNFMQQINSLFAADTQRLLDSTLTLSAGFRVAMACVKAPA